MVVVHSSDIPTFALTQSKMTSNFPLQSLAGEELLYLDSEIKYCLVSSFERKVIVIKSECFQDKVKRNKTVEHKQPSVDKTSAKSSPSTLYQSHLKSQIPLQISDLLIL